MEDFLKSLQNIEVCFDLICKQHVIVRWKKKSLRYLSFLLVYYFSIRYVLFKLRVNMTCFRICSRYNWLKCTSYQFLRVFCQFRNSLADKFTHITLRPQKSAIKFLFKYCNREEFMNARQF